MAKAASGEFRKQHEQSPGNVPQRRARRVLAASSAAALIALAGCGSVSDSEESLPAPVGGPLAPATIGEVQNPATVDEDATATRSDEPVVTTGVSTPCIVSLHGKGGDGAGASSANGVTLLSPRGNDEGWGGRQWNYLDADAYADAASVVANSIDDAGCSAVAVHGFSNGAAFAAKLFCQGETFGDRLVGVVIDDPVADSATANCEPGASVNGALYWTGALAAAAPAGTNCGGIDWTCEGGVIVGIEAFAAAAGLDVMPSPFTDHRRFDDAPEPALWLDAAGA